MTDQNDLNLKFASDIASLKENGKMINEKLGALIIKVDNLVDFEMKKSIRLKMYVGIVSGILATIISLFIKFL
jgi:hypothetical protein